METEELIIWYMGLISVIIGIVIIYDAVIDDDSDSASNVYSELDEYGGVIYLTETTGSGSSSLVKWYVPVDSGIGIQDGYLHVDQAKSWINDSYSVNIFIPLSAILYISVNSA